MEFSIARFLFFFLLTGITTLSAQKIHEVPELDLNKFTDDWYQFDALNVSFDVEIKATKITSGTIVWADGSSYMGTLKHHIITGKGTYVWANGIRYEGRFLNNQRHGRGSLILQDNTKWYGTWKNHQRHGKGKIYDANGALVRKGVWENGREVTKS